MLCVVYMVYFSLALLTAGLEYHWHPSVHSLVQSYWIVKAKCLCAWSVWEGSRYVLYTFQMPSAVFQKYSFLKYIIFGNVFFPSMWLLTLLSLHTQYFKTCNVIWINNYRLDNRNYVNENTTSFFIVYKHNRIQCVYVCRSLSI